MSEYDTVLFQVGTDGCGNLLVGKPGEPPTGVISLQDRTAEQVEQELLGAVQHELHELELGDLVAGSTRREYHVQVWRRLRSDRHGSWEFELDRPTKGEALSAGLALCSLHQRRKSVRVVEVTTTVDGEMIDDPEVLHTWAKNA